MLWLFLCLAFAPFAPRSSAQPQASTRERFVLFHAAKDEAGCEKLWRENPGEVLYAIDEDLEGSLATWEKSPEKPDASAIAAQQERAIWGARLATRASGHPIFFDYASSFAGLTEPGKRDFRAGQRAHGASRGALKAKDFATAEAEARKCIALAAPLGDWWGHAMGLAALGDALAAAGKHADAVAPLGEAALIYRDLQLAGAELAALRTLAKSLTALDAKLRAKAVLERAIAIAKAAGEAKLEAELSAELAALAK
jgi:hypothetical protein